MHIFIFAHQHLVQKKKIKFSKTEQVFFHYSPRMRHTAACPMSSMREQTAVILFTISKIEHQLSKLVYRLVPAVKES